MSFLETESIKYVQTSLLPEEDFTVAPEEEIENLIRQFKTSGLIEVEEREIPVSPENWSEEKEKLERNRNATFIAATRVGLIYSLEDNSQLLLKPAILPKDQEYHWELSAIEVYYNLLLKELDNLQLFNVVEKTPTNVILTAIGRENKYTLDILKSYPTLQQIDPLKIQENLPEIRETIKMLSIVNGYRDFSVKYMDTSLYGEENFFPRNTYTKNSLTLEYSSSISEKDLIGYSNLALLELVSPFNLKGVTRRLPSDVTKTKYRALELGFTKTKSQNKFIYPGNDVSLILERSNENVTKWEIEVPIEKVKDVIEFLYYLNPYATGQSEIEGNTTMILPTPKSKDKNIIRIIAKK